MDEMNDRLKLIYEKTKKDIINGLPLTKGITVAIDKNGNFIVNFSEELIKKSYSESDIFDRLIESLGGNNE